MNALDLLQNVTLLVTLVVIYRLAGARLDRHRVSGRLAFGLIFGAVAVAGMMAPWHLLPGIAFDGRSVIVSLAGVFGGLWTAAIAALIAASYRLSLGGDGVAMGCGVVVTSALLGVGLRALRHRQRRPVTKLDLYLLGVVVHLVMLAWTPALPEARRLEVLRAIALPVLVALPLATLLVGWMLLEQDAQGVAEAALRASETQFRSLFQSMAQGVVYQDATGQIVSANPAAERLLGLTLAQMQGKTSLDPDWRAIREDGTPFPGETHPAMVALRTGEEQAPAVMGVFNPTTQGYRWLHVHAVPQFDPGTPAPQRVFTTFEDLTQHRDHELEILRLNRLYAALSQVNQAVVRGGSQPALLATVCRVMVEHGQFRLVAVSELDPATRRAQVLARHGQDAAYLDEVEVFADDRPEGRGPTGTCLREGRGDVCHDFFADPRMAPWQPAARRYGFRSSAAFPIRFRGAVWGALTVFDSQPDFFRDREVKLLEEVAVDISYALDALEQQAERARALAALAASEERYRYLFERNPHPMWVYDRQSLALLEVNTAALENYGYSRAEFLAMTILDLHAPADHPRIREAVQILTGKLRRPGVYRQRRKNGTWIDADLVTHDLDFDGGAARLVLAQDVTARLEAETALRENEERLRLALQAGHQGFYDLNVQTGEAVVSPEYASLLGYDPATFRETNARWIERLHPDDREPVAAAYRDYLEGRLPLYRVEFRQRTATGGYIWILSLGKIVTRDATGQPLRMLGTHTDITDRKEAEIALRESEARFRLLYEHSPVPYQSLDADGNFVEVNQAWLKLLDYERHEVIGRWFGDFLRPDNLDVFGERFPCFKRLGEIHGFEFDLVRKDGQVATVSVDGRIGRRPDGAFKQTHCVLHDITDRKRAETALVRSEQQLRALSARIETLREEERTRIAREIHDELGQMLTGLKMDLRWIEHRLDAFGDDRRVNPILDKLVAANELADATVKTVQRIAAELRPGILDKLGLPTALQYEAAQFEARTGTPCRVSVPAEDLRLPPPVATAFFRIFQEALTNVARHAHATAVEVLLLASTHECRLEIRDNGRGLTPLQLANPQSLGLLGMQERAHILGGSVRFTTPPPGGTVVTVQLPHPV